MSLHHLLGFVILTVAVLFLICSFPFTVKSGEHRREEER
jgi:hypothetical protein